MKDDLLAHLYDILQAARSINEFVSGASFDKYISDELLRSAVERKFEIMGEALNRASRTDPDVLNHIRDCRDIISFRNILIHGYDAIDDQIVWETIEEDLANLIQDVDTLLKERLRESPSPEQTESVQ